MIERIKIGLSTPLIKNTLKLSSSNVVLYFFPILVTPILSRLYTPDFFGNWGIFASTFTIISVAMFGSYDNAIIKSSDKELNPLSVLCIILGFISTILAIVVFLIGEALGIRFFVDFPYKWFLFLYLVIYLFTTVYQNRINREGRYTLLASSNLLCGILQGVLRVTWGMACKIWNGLIFGTIAANATNLIFLLFKSKGHLLKDVSCKKIKETAISYKRFPIFDAPAILLQFAALNLPVIILSFYFSRSDIGCYSLIVQLLILPISFVGSAMGKVYYQQLSTITKNNKLEIQIATLQVLKILAILSIVPSIVICLGGDKLLIWFLGNKWQVAGEVSICMAIWSIPTILTESLKHLFRITDQQKYLLYNETTYFVFGIGVLLLGCYCAWELLTIIFIYSVVCCLIKFMLFNKILKLSNNNFSKLPLLSRIFIGLTILIITSRVIMLLC